MDGCLEHSRDVGGRGSYQTSLVSCDKRAVETGSIRVVRDYAVWGFLARRDGRDAASASAIH